MAVWFYHVSGANWIGFVVLFLASDLSWLGYLAGNRAGAVVYNLVHNNVIPAALAVVGFVAGNAPAMSVALIWLGHIGADRLLGFGLKYPSGFKDTHLGTLRSAR